MFRLAHLPPPLRHVLLLLHQTPRALRPPPTRPPTTPNTRPSRLPTASSPSTSPFSTTRTRPKKAAPLPPRPKPPPESEIEENFLRGSGPGGQKINKTSSAVQLKHLPTGIVLKCQATRSRSQNRAIARQLLAARLDDLTRGDESRSAVVGALKGKKRASSAKKSRRKYRKLEEEKAAAAGGSGSGGDRGVEGEYDDDVLDGEEDEFDDDVEDDIKHGDPNSDIEKQKLDHIDDKKI